MAEPNSAGRLGFQFEFQRAPSAPPRPREADAPLRLLVAGDFTGRAARGVIEPLAGRRTRTVDIDKLESVFAELATKVDCASAGGFGAALQSVPIESLESFHPETLLRTLPPLRDILAARRGLDAANSEESAARLRELLPATSASAGAPPAPAAAPTLAASATPGSREADVDTLARLLGGERSASAPAPRTATPAPASGVDMQALIKRVVGSAGSAPTPVVGASGLAAAAELELSARLRAILHGVQWQRIEAAWRGLDFLVRRCPDEERVKFAVLDLSLAEIEADPGGLARLVRDGAADAVVLLETFGRSIDDLGSLGVAAAVCGGLGLALFAGADPQLAGCTSFAAHPDPDDWNAPETADVRAAWHEVRAAPEMKHVWLAAPRFILRQPYGRAGEPIESYAFDEAPAGGSHEDFLWGHPALLLALCQAAAFAEGDGDPRTPAAGAIDELPLVRVVSSEGPGALPCAEAWLTDRAITRLHACGLSAIQSVRGADRVMVLPRAAFRAG